MKNNIKSDKFVSIIMSEYNTNPSYLNHAIDSILKQTYSDFELIIIDDVGFNDLEFITLAFNDDRIRVIKNLKNMGLVYSLNTAIKNAKGKYLVRMDTDDIAMPNRIEKLVDFILIHPEYAVVGSRVIEFSGVDNIGILSYPGEKDKKSIMKGDVPIHPSVIMEKNAIVEVGGYPGYKRAEDLALWCELLLNGKRLYVLDSILLKYRVDLIDYKKRGIKTRGGEIKARLHYYPLLGSNARDYIRIVKSIIAGITPPSIVSAYRKKFVIENYESNKYSLLNELYPLISIIVPVYNVEDNLENCLNTIIKQSYENIEIILVDDGSSDKSSDICDLYSKRDDRVRVLHTANMGVSSARNLGLDSIRGDFVTFIDSDDLVSEYYVANLYTAIAVNESDISISSFSVVKNEKKIKILDNNFKTNIKSLNRNMAIVSLLRGKDIQNNVFSKLFKATLVDDIRFSEKLSVGEDLYFIFETLLKSSQINVIDSYDYYYINRSNSAMHASISNKRLGGINAAEDIFNILSKNTIFKSAAQSKIFSEAIFLLSDTKTNDESEIIQKCKFVILSVSNFILKDNQAKIIYRIYALLAILNFSLLIKILRAKTSLRTIV